MIYRTLGNNGALVSVIGMGCEGFEGKTEKECEHLFSCAANQGINFFDLYTPNPRTRQYFGKAMKKHPEKQFILQGHLCTVWKDGQYSRTRNMQKVQSSFEALLSDLQLGCIDVGMIHYVDGQQDFDMVMGGAVLAYAKQLQKDGVIRSIGLSTHNPDIALLAVQSGCIDVIMFSINPAYDMLPPDEDVNILFEEGTFDRVYEGIDPKRDMLYRLCQNQGVALTVMKPFAGGLLLDSGQSPFGRAATPVQCISYCLDRPAVASVMGGMTSDAEIEAAVQYCTAGEEERDYSEILS